MSCERFNLGPVRNDVSAAWDLSSHDIAICNYLFDKNLTITNVYGYDFLKKILMIYLQFQGKLIK